MEKQEKSTCSLWMLCVLSSNIFIDMNSSFVSGLITKEPTLMCYLEICDYSLWIILRHCDRSSNYLSCFWRKKSAEMRFAKLKSWQHLKVYILLILIVRQLHAWHRGAPAYSHELWASSEKHQAWVCKWTYCKQYKGLKFGPFWRKY